MLPVFHPRDRIPWATDDPLASIPTPIPPDCALRKGTGIDEFEIAFPDDQACLAYIFAKRYGQGFACPKCGNAADWISREDARVYASRCCGRLIYPQRGTMFQRSRKLPLKEWFRGLLFATNSTGTPGAKFYRRYFELSAKAAVRMANKIRLQMALRESDRVIGGAGDNIYLSEVRFLRVRRLARTGYKSKRVISLSDGCKVAFIVPECSQASHIMRALAPRVKPDAVLHCADEALYKRLVRCGKASPKQAPRSVANMSGNFGGGTSRSNQKDRLGVTGASSARGCDRFGEPLIDISFDPGNDSLAEVAGSRKSPFPHSPIDGRARQASAPPDFRETDEAERRHQRELLGAGSDHYVRPAASIDGRASPMAWSRAASSAICAPSVRVSRRAAPSAS